MSAKASLRCTNPISGAMTTSGSERLVQRRAEVGFIRATSFSEVRQAGGFLACRARPPAGPGASEGGGRMAITATPLRDAIFWQRRQRDALHVRQHQDAVRHAGAGDHAIVDEIEVITGIFDGGNEVGAERLVHGLIDGIACPGFERGEGVGGGQIDGHVVGRLPWRRRKLMRCRYSATSGITRHHGLWSLNTAAA